MHRSTDLVGGDISTRRGIPTTNPLRSLVDMAADAPRALLDEALDTALARRLVTVEGLIAEAMRLKRRGRRGPAQLLQCLSQRGFAGAPSPSVLESRLLRVLATAGIPVMNREVVLKELGYRLDIQLEDLLFLEVDGYAYHWSPEQKRHDDARRNKLWSRGLTVLVYDWKAVVSEPRRLVAEVRQVLSTPTRKTASDRPKGGPVTARRPS
jgi:very-short-patch-repair endonuclease